MTDEGGRGGEGGMWEERREDSGELEESADRLQLGTSFWSTSTRVKKH